MGSLDSRSSEKAAVLMAALIFIIIGPAFAAPRTGLVAYEMAVKPFFVEASQAHLTAFSVIFCGCNAVFLVPRPSYRLDR